MLWVLVDIAVGAAGVALLALTALRLYKRIRRLTSTIGSASARIGELTPGLAVEQPGRSGAAEVR